MTFDKWIDTFVSEKGLDLEETFVVEGDMGENSIPLGVVVEHMKIAPDTEKKQIKDVIVRIDFYNGNVMHFFEHLAKAIAI